MNEILKKKIRKLEIPYLDTNFQKLYFQTLKYHPKRHKNTLVLGFWVLGKGWLMVEVRKCENQDFDGPLPPLTTYTIYVI